MGRRILSSFCLFLAMVLCLAEAAGTVKYRYQDLGVWGGNFSTATAINIHGQVVGYADTNPDNNTRNYHAFLWTPDGGLQDLQTLGGNYSRAFGINDSGQVVGDSFTASGESHAFVWMAAPGMEDLGSLENGHGSGAYGINNAGQVVGTANTAADGKVVWQGFTWTKTGGMQGLSLGLGSGYNNYAQAINLGGDIVGYYYLRGGISTIFRGFLWSGNLVDLGGFGGSDTVAEAVNNKQQIVGYSSEANDLSHAFLWDSVNQMQDLGFLPGCSNPSLGAKGFGLNNLGQVVGTCDSRAFLWTESAGMQDLNVLVINPPAAPQFLLYAYAINDNGQIVGATGGVNNNAALGHAFLLTPVPDNPAAAAWLNLLID